MTNHHRAMYHFAQLAAISQQKRQPNQTADFLLLTGFEAVPAELTELSARCRELVLINHPRHLAGNHETLEAMFADDDSSGFIKRLAKFCTPEKAEYLLQELGQPVDCADNADYALETYNLLHHPVWETE